MSEKKIKPLKHRTIAELEEKRRKVLRKIRRLSRLDSAITFKIWIRKQK
jgi:hypothetical protein